MVGLLIRARKKELLTFDGEMLYQGKDDEEWISLTKSINSIREYFGRDGDIPGGGHCQGPRKLSLEDSNSNSESDISIAAREMVENISGRLTSSEHGEQTEQTELGVGLPKEKTKNRLLNQSLRNSFRKNFKNYSLRILIDIFKLKVFHFDYSF